MRVIFAMPLRGSLIFANALILSFAGHAQAGLALEYQIHYQPVEKAEEWLNAKGAAGWKLASIVPGQKCPHPDNSRFMANCYLLVIERPKP